jgi:tetratricopeptide (TPR) repeat protein
MQFCDQRGLLVSCERRESVEGYERALSLLQGYYIDPLKEIDDTLAQDPRFVMGHAFRAALFVTAGDRRALPELGRSLQAAEALCARGIGTERERAHLAAARAWVEGKFGEACLRYNRIVADYPRDVLALQVSHITNFFLGRSTWLRDQVAGALPHYSPNEPSYGYVLGMLAFGLEECNEFTRAEAAGQRALEHNRRDAWAIHALAHCAEMCARVQDGIRLYEERKSDWAENNFFSVHNWWHLGLYYLDLGDSQRVLALYDEQIRASRSEMMFDLIDASAFLWRLQLAGIDVGQRWQELAQTWQRIEEEGFYAFNDWHATMAYAGAGRRGDVERVLRGLERAASEPGTNAMMTREVGLPACRAFAAFADGDYQTTLAELIELRPIASRFGGSNAQRDLLDWTLAEAALRSGDTPLARTLIEARVARKPASQRERKTLARVFEQAAVPASSRQRSSLVVASAL